MSMRYIDYIVFHCSAGYAGVEGIRRFWRETLGWKMDGYHRFVLLNGDVDEMQPWSVVTNGVKGYNSRALHICYQGGVLRDNVRVAADTRTPEQKESLLRCLGDAYRWVARYQDVSAVKIRGHRDFSPAKTGNGAIEPEERIKECPSFDGIAEYGIYQGTKELKSLTLL